VTDVVVDVGDYVLSEAGGPPDYTAGDWDCTPVAASGDTVQVGSGDHVTCTIANTFNGSPTTPPTSPTTPTTPPTTPMTHPSSQSPTQSPPAGGGTSTSGTGGTGTSGESTSGASGGALPFTGLPSTLLVAAGLVMILIGLPMMWAVRRRGT